MCRQRANTAPVDVEDPHERLSGEVVCRGSRQVDSNPVKVGSITTNSHTSHIGPARRRRRDPDPARAPRTAARICITRGPAASAANLTTRSRIRGAVANTRYGLMPVISTRMPLHTSVHALCSLVTLIGRQRSANSAVRRSCPTVTRRARARASSQLARPKRPKRPKRPPWPVA